ncbi:MAG TPA: protein kinase, partial [Polyangiaceae bacterium]
EQRVIHRDLKPSNVLVGAFGETIVIDWGLAKDLSLADDPSEREGSPYRRTSDATEVGTVVGTPSFMPPEQARGEEVDERADVYGLGALLYFTLSGKAPHDVASRTEVLARVRERPPPPLADVAPGVAPDLIAIVARAMARDKGERYPSAKQLAEDLKRFQAGQMVSAHRYSLTERLARWVRRHKAIAATTLIFAGVAAVGVLAFGVRESRLRHVAEAEKERADRKSLALLEQQGRDELDGGRPFRAAVFLSEAYLRDAQSLVVRSLLTEALRPLAARRMTLVGHQRDVPAGAYSPDGSLVATGSDDRTVRIWDVRSGELLHTVEGFPGALEWVAFSHDGKALAASSAGQHPRISVLDVLSGRTLSSFDLPVSFRVEFTPDDDALVGGGFDGDLRIIDRATGALRLDAPAFRDRVSAIDFRAGTSQMVVGSHDRGLEIWDWRTGKRVAALAPFDHPVSSAHFSRDGRYLLVAESERSLQVYDAESLVRLRTLSLPDAALDPDAFFSPDARLVVAGTKDGRIRVWHTSSGALLRLIDAQPAGQLYRMALRSDGTEVATMGGDGAVNLWSLDAALDYRLLGAAAIDDASVLASAYVEHGRTIVMPTADGEVRVLDAKGQLSRSFRVGSPVDTSAIDGSARRFAATGETVASFPPRLWDLDTGRIVAELVPQAGPLVYGLAATSDGRAFLTGDYVGVLREWDATTGALRAEHPVTSARISSIAASPDGTSIAVADENGMVFFVDRVSGAVTRTLQAHGCWIQSMTYGDDGETLVTVGRQDHTLKVWRAPFEVPVVLSGHTAQGRRASISGDGRRIASVSGDGTARLWDARTGELLRVIQGPSTTAVFRPGTDELLTTGDRGYEVVWDTTLDARTPREIADYVARQSPWKLVDGRLVLARR